MRTSGRGRTPSQLPGNFLEAASVTSQDNEYFLRDVPLNVLDGAAFHYSVYRALTRFLGMDGQLAIPNDIDVNFVTAWNEMVLTNDFLNANTGQMDPRHLYGTSSVNQFRWPSVAYGIKRSALGTFITTILMPGIPLVSCP
jgi:alpha-1,3-glucan synthase